jgi:lipid A oxidase
MRFATPLRLRSVLAQACFLLTAVATPASAEWYFDLYGGGAYTPNSDIKLLVNTPGGNADHTFHDVKWDKSGEYGLRLGFWFDRARWYGMGLDVFRFNANVPMQTVDTTIGTTNTQATLQKIDFAVAGVGVDLIRVRLPLATSGRYPYGRFQPYATAGPAVFRVRVTNRDNGELTTDPAYDTATGYKVGAGLSWQISQSVAIFGEYRYTHFRAEADLQGTITGARIPTQFDLNTHHAVAGLSFHF